MRVEYGFPVSGYLRLKFVATLTQILCIGEVGRLKHDDALLI